MKIEDMKPGTLFKNTDGVLIKTKHAVLNNDCGLDYYICICVYSEQYEWMQGSAYNICKGCEYEIVVPKTAEKNIEQTEKDVNRSIADAFKKLSDKLVWERDDLRNLLNRYCGDANLAGRVAQLEHCIDDVDELIKHYELKRTSAEVVE